MPLYDYKCPQHGLFYQLATLEDSAKPCACPVCGQLGARVVILSPALLTMKASNREAHARNERARHEPVFSNPDARQEQMTRHKHGKGCGCRPLDKPSLIYTADGKKMFPSMRPWMISH